MALTEETKNNMIKEVKSLMSNKQVVNQAYFSEKYNMSRASFYNILKDNNIDDIGVYNKMVKNKDKIKSAKFNFKIDPRFAKINEQAKVNIEISKREGFWDGDKKLNIIDHNTKEEKKEEIVVNESEDNIYKFESVKPFIIAGLVSDRHDSIDRKVDLFIYNGIVLRGEKILDFDYLYDIADKFITKEVIDKGYNKLKLYVTGLQPTLASVIKASYDKGITLILLHYNSANGKYVEQFICGTDDNESNLSLLQLYASTKRFCDIRLIGHDMKYYNNLNHLYIIKTDDQNNVNVPIIYITDDMNMMFKKYQEEIQRVIPSKPIPYRVICEELAFGTTNTEFVFPNQYGVYYNTPKNNTYNN